MRIIALAECDFTDIASAGFSYKGGSSCATN